MGILSLYHTQDTNSRSELHLAIARNPGYDVFAVSRNNADCGMRGNPDQAMIYFLHATSVTTLDVTRGGIRHMGLSESTFVWLGWLCSTTNR